MNMIIEMFTIDGEKIREKEISDESYQKEAIIDGDRFWFSEESRQSNQIYWKVKEPQP